MERYSIIHNKFPREFVLLQGTGCRWGRCSFCDYHTDVSDNPFEINRAVLELVTGEYGVLDIINSGSCFELDDQTIALIQRIVQEKKIHTLWFEVHWMYRHRLEEFRLKITDNRLQVTDLTPSPAGFPLKQRENISAHNNTQLSVKFRCGIETFDPDLRTKWNKGVPANVTAEDVAKYFQGVCLLCCTEGETRERIVRDIQLAEQYFEYFSVNVFCNNTTSIKRDTALVEWFIHDLYPTIKENPHLEILLDNTDLGVG